MKNIYFILIVLFFFNGCISKNQYNPLSDFVSLFQDKNRHYTNFYTAINGPKVKNVEYKKKLADTKYDFLEGKEYYKYKYTLKFQIYNPEGIENLASYKINFSETLYFKDDKQEKDLFENQATYNFELTSIFGKSFEQKKIEIDSNGNFETTFYVESFESEGDVSEDLEIHIYLKSKNGLHIDFYATPSN